MRLAHPGVAFLDRDGTINEKAPEGEYVESPGAVRLLPGAAAAIRALNDAGVAAIAVTNQRGIALGRMTEADLQAVHARLAELLEQEAGARIDRIYHCPHAADSCDCRKPLPGMLLQAKADQDWIDLGRSVTIGDNETDVLAGRAAGTATILLGRDATDLEDAVAQLIRR